MPECLKVLASLSLSGSLAIVVLLLLKPPLRGRVSRRWQYYVWLIAVFRLLLPLSPETSPVGRRKRRRLSEPRFPIRPMRHPRRPEPP